MRANWNANAMRWVRFNFIGLLGVAVQMASLAVLTRRGMPYLPATVLAVEITVLHNFVWHELYTWRDRPSTDVLLRLVRFHLGNGAISLLGNTFIMWLLVGCARAPILAANAISIITLSVVNFLVSDRLVFREASETRA